jgi:hypothetical protein
MRIGDVNQDNYKQFLKLFGIKDSKALDNIMGKDGKASTKQTTEDEVYAQLVREGRVEEGMLIKEGDDISKYNRIVPVSDEVRNKIIDTVRRQFLENGNGMTKPGDSDEFAKIGKDYRKNIPPSERLAVSWTLNKIQLDEAQRLVDYVKSKNPSWNYGQRFDKSILTSTDFGTKSVDIKA